MIGFSRRSGIHPNLTVQKSRLITAFSEQAYSKGYGLQKLGAERVHSKQRWRFCRPRPPLTPCCSKLVAVLPHDRCGRFKPNDDAAALIDISALGGNSTDDVLGCQYHYHVAATLTGRVPSHAIIGVNRFSTASLQFTRVIPEIDIWRAANLMLNRIQGQKELVAIPYLVSIRYRLITDKSLPRSIT